MKRIFERLVFIAGLATIGLLLWTLNPSAVWSHVRGVGLAGLLGIITLQLLDHMLNALGWRMTFSAPDARRIPFWRLVLGRAGGDGVNYLVPSGTIAGEIIRPLLLGNGLPSEVKNSSVVTAKFTQGLGQALFILLGLSALPWQITRLSMAHRFLGLSLALAMMAFLGFALYLILGLAFEDPGRWPTFLRRWESSLISLRRQMRSYFKAHPGRFSLSVLFFAAGYAWGAIEVWLVCWLMNFPIPPLFALAVEVLSNVIDALTFMVPAKAGTQEAGKTAIFAGLGYPAGLGLAFGLVRHVREIFWACLGFSLYVLLRGRRSRSRRTEGLDGAVGPDGVRPSIVRR